MSLTSKIIVAAAVSIAAITPVVVYAVRKSRS